jgi:hypothetical protein
MEDLLSTTNALPLLELLPDGLLQNGLLQSGGWLDALRPAGLLPGLGVLLTRLILVLDPLALDSGLDLGLDLDLELGLEGGLDAVLLDPTGSTNALVFVLIAALGLVMALIYVPLRLYLTLTARSRRLKLLQRIRRLREELSGGLAAAAGQDAAGIGAGSASMAKVEGPGVAEGLRSGPLEDPLIEPPLLHDPL